MQNQIQTLFSDRKNSLVHLVTESESMDTNKSCRLTITLCEGDWSPAEVVQGDWGIFIFKGHLDTVLCNMLCVALLEEGSWTRWTPEGPFGHQPFCVLWFCEPELHCYGQKVSREEFSCLLQRLTLLPNDGDADKVALLTGYTQAVPGAVGSSDFGVQPPDKACPVQTSVQTSDKRPSEDFYLKVFIYRTVINIWEE